MVDSLVGSTYTMIDSLDFGTHYWWRVTARNKAGLTAVSSIADFWTTCYAGTTGNVNPAGIVDGGDLPLLVAYLTNPPLQKPTLPCPEEANINAAGIVDGGDLALLVAYLTNPPGMKPTLPNCP